MGHGLVIDTLLLHGADVNLRVSDGSGRDGTPLMCAALYGHPAVVLRLLRADGRYSCGAELAVTAFFAVIGGFCTTDFLQLVARCHIVKFFLGPIPG